MRFCGDDRGPYLRSLFQLRNVGRVAMEAISGWCLNSGLKVGIFVAFLVLDE